MSEAESRSFSIDELAAGLGHGFNALTSFVTGGAGAAEPSPAPRDEVHEQLREATAERLARVRDYLDTAKQMEQYRQEGASSSHMAELWAGAKFLGGATDAVIGAAANLFGLNLAPSAVGFAKGVGDYVGGRMVEHMREADGAERMETNGVKDALEQTKLIGGGAAEMKELPDVDRKALGGLGDVGEGAGLVTDVMKAKEGYASGDDVKGMTGSLGAAGSLAKLVGEEEAGRVVGGVGKVVEGTYGMREGVGYMKDAVSQELQNDRSAEHARDLPLRNVAKEQEAIAEQFHAGGHAPTADDLGGRVYVIQDDGSVAESDVDTLMAKVAAPPVGLPEAPVPPPAMLPFAPEPAVPSAIAEAGSPPPQVSMPLADDMPGALQEPQPALPAPHIADEGFTAPTMPSDGAPNEPPALLTEPPALLNEPPVLQTEPPAMPNDVGITRPTSIDAPLTEAAETPGIPYSVPDMSSDVLPAEFSGAVVNDMDFQTVFHQVEQQLQQSGASAEDLSSFRSMEGSIEHAAESATMNGGFDVPAFENGLGESDMSAGFAGEVFGGGLSGEEALGAAFGGPPDDALGETGGGMTGDEFHVPAGDEPYAPPSDPLGE